ncbi:uncharacterized protein LOC116943136 [Petromyzon marinus]|uniref:uncharacterized protein LOC116943136 n=1 Tax=Petromyzon marinus TaxID=7757 RepID=UPI003F715B61
MDRSLGPKPSPPAPRHRPTRAVSPGPLRGREAGAWDRAPQRGRSRSPSHSGDSAPLSPANRLRRRSVSLGELSRSPALGRRVDSLAREVVGSRPGRSQSKGQAKGPATGVKGDPAMLISEKDRKIATLMLAKHAEREIEGDIRARAQLQWDSERTEREKRRRAQRAEERARGSASWLPPASPPSLLGGSFPPSSSASPGIPRRARREPRSPVSSLGRELGERLKLLQIAETAAAAASRGGSVSSSRSHSSPPEVLEIVREEDEEEAVGESESEPELEAVGRQASFWLSNGNGSWECPAWGTGSPGLYPRAMSPTERAFEQAWRIQRARIAARQQAAQTMERHRFLLQDTEERTQRAARIAQEQLQLRAELAEQRRREREAQHRSTLLRLAELEEQRRRGHEEAAARSRDAGLRAARERDVARDAARALARAACRVRERVRDAVNSRSFHHVAREAEVSARTLRHAPPW